MARKKKKGGWYGDSKGHAKAGRGEKVRHFNGGIEVPWRKEPLTGKDKKLYTKLLETEHEIEKIAERIDDVQDQKDQAKEKIERLKNQYEKKREEKHELEDKLMGD
ncbi:MAG: hypothetical protein ACOC53_05345 [Candidatus Saliniplasma sp.]